MPETRDPIKATIARRKRERRKAERQLVANGETVVKLRYVGGVLYHIILAWGEETGGRVESAKELPKPGKEVRGWPAEHGGYYPRPYQPYRPPTPPPAKREEPFRFSSRW